MIFSSESVSEGHPDKVCDQISDAILDACLEQDPESRVACETMCTTDRVIVAGEITSNAEIDPESIARSVVRDIGYTVPGIGFDADNFRFESLLHKQSADISRGVDSDGEKEQGAGDQGMVFGYAEKNPLTNYMPVPIYFAHKFMLQVAQLRKTTNLGKFLLPDGKCQFTFQTKDIISTPIEYELILRAAVLSQQHTESADLHHLAEVFKNMVSHIIPAEMMNENFDFFFNPTGNFNLGGPAWDTGLTGRKIVVDTYGGWGRVGGGAFSGKDPSKVDRSGAYMCRAVAKHLVKNGFCDRCEIQVGYIIGVANPVSINLEAYNCDTKEITEYVKKNFDFRPAAIIERLQLKNPKNWNYRQTAFNGHFGHNHFPWEQDL